MQMALSILVDSVWATKQMGVGGNIIAARLTQIGSIGCCAPVKPYYQKEAVAKGVGTHD